MSAWPTGCEVCGEPLRRRTLWLGLDAVTRESVFACELYCQQEDRDDHRHPAAETAGEESER